MNDRSILAGEGGMQIARMVFVVSLAVVCSTGASAQSPCSRVGQIICDSKSGMEMRCEQTASQITPIITGKRCPPVRAEKTCAETARDFEARVARFNGRCTGVGSVSQAALYQQCADEKAALAAEQTRICARCPGCK
ncbi:MAG TPA: hypothetical protein VF913_05980 [Xanthobacteraceae bacterium]